MSRQNPWRAYPASGRSPERHYTPHMGADDSSTFVKPLHAGSSQTYSPYGFSTETAMPPPPPGIDAPVVAQLKRNTGYLIALVVLSGLVVTLGSLEILQVATHTLSVPGPSVTAGLIRPQAPYQLST